MTHGFLFSVFHFIVVWFSFSSAPLSDLNFCSKFAEFLLFSNNVCQTLLDFVQILPECCSEVRSAENEDENRILKLENAYDTKRNVLRKIFYGSGKYLPEFADICRNSKSRTHPGRIRTHPDASGRIRK